VSRHDREWLADSSDAGSGISDHLQRGTLDDGPVFDAVRLRLIEIGEAVRRVSPELLANEPDIPWVDTAGMRDQIAHRSVDTSREIVPATIDSDLPPPSVAVQGLLRADPLVDGCVGATP
jgi:uncharacterized protein with HEPN domain